MITFAGAGRPAAPVEKTTMEKMLRRYKEMIICLLLMAGTGGGISFSQDNSGKRYPMPATGNYMRYIVENGDTLYVGTISPSYSFGINKKKDWRRYSRLVRNFAVVYPYSLLAQQLVRETDSTFRVRNFSRRQKEKYVNNLQKRIFVSYEKTARNMTISQGQLMMKLIDREVGKSSYEIIKYYKNGMAAGFWQGLAKMFGTDMKKHYDPTGEDRDIEELIKKWNSGEFPELYYSIFREYPSIPEVPENLR